MMLMNCVFLVEEIAYHGVNAATMAGLDEKLDVGIHEWYGHGDVGTVWENKLGEVAQTLDGAEDVIPSTAVET
jgi:hypothetical protein